MDAGGNDLPHDGKSQGEILLRGPWIIERYHKLDDDVTGSWTATGALATSATSTRAATSN